MQDLLRENDEVSHRVYELARTAPGYREAALAHEALARRIREILGYELYDAYLCALTPLFRYESRALASPVEEMVFIPRSAPG